MTRRTPLSPQARSELALRAKYGSGHDYTAPVADGGRTISSLQARQQEPTPAMLNTTRQVMEWLRDNDAVGVSITRDIRKLGHPGCITVLWSSGPSAAQCAAQFQVSQTRGGLPLIPGWLSLRAVDDWDLRWQATYAPIDTAANPRDAMRIASGW